MSDNAAAAGAPRRRIAVVGAGWAGLAAAVEAARRGAAVSLFEMAPQAGGRARRVAGGTGWVGRAGGDERAGSGADAADAASAADATDAADASAAGAAAAGTAVADTATATDAAAPTFDNGQHILIGAYAETLRLMALVGVDASRALLRRPLALVHPDGRGLVLPPGPAIPAFVRAVVGHSGWTVGERFALLAATIGWAARGFRCDPALTVAQLCRRLPARLGDELINPLAVAALNTPAAQASAAVFLRVLKDALFSGPGGSDLLLPRVDLGALWPDAALRFLTGHGVACRFGARVGALAPRAGSGWTVDGEAFDGVVLATSVVEAARLARPHAPAWADRAAALRHEPIVTVVLHAEGARLAQPMLALHAGPERPAQFVFDLGALRGQDGMLAFVVSGAGEWVARGLDATIAATLAQAREALPTAALGGGLRPLRVFAEKRATFLCTPGLDRPPVDIAPGLAAAGDYIAGPYPATLEGAMRAGTAAAGLLLGP